MKKSIIVERETLKNMLIKGRYRLLNHTADYMLEVTAKSKEMLFVNVSYALADIMYDVEKVQIKTTKILDFSGDNIEEMLKNFISRIIRLVCGDYFLYRKISVNLSKIGYKGYCRVKGEEIDRSRHVLKKEIKALTEHNFRLEKVGRERKVIFVVDV